MPIAARRNVGESGPASPRSRSVRGTAYTNVTRRRGRAAHQRSPDDSPLRDGNRDRLIGLLTLRAAKTLEYYFMETNLTYHHWLSEYIRQNPIPLEGKWDDVSGESFLRRLLTESVNETRYRGGVKDPLFSCVGTIGIDPRAIGQRIMDIRSALAQEFIQDLQAIAEENAILMRECAMMSLEALQSMGSDDEDAEAAPAAHPEMMDQNVAIPDTAAEFLASMKETSIERFKRQLERSGSPSDSASSTDDEVRPGLDDINEFESELEAADKWKRRFRLLKDDQVNTGKGSDGDATGGDAPKASAEDAASSKQGDGKQEDDVVSGALDSEADKKPNKPSKDVSSEEDETGDGKSPKK